MNGLTRNTELHSQAGIRQYDASSEMLLEQLEHLGVQKADLECNNIVFSDAFFLFSALIFIVSIIGIFVILYFWGAVFFVREKPSPGGNHSRSREIGSREVS